MYTLGDSDPQADVTCFFARWDASRSKKYTTSETERQELLADHAREDGVAFYVPAEATDSTTQVYFDESQPHSQWQQRYYFVDGPEADKRTSKTPAFAIEAKEKPGTQPLMRAFYSNTCGWSHDELAVGKERWNRVYRQGDKLPWWSVLWTGISKPTTLVVEALDAGCPYQGFFAPVSMPAAVSHYGTSSIFHEQYRTLSEMQAGSPSTEVFMNGQHGPAWIWQSALLPDGIQPTPPPAPPLPKAVARSFVKVEPKPHPTMDFFETFNGEPEVFTKAPCRDGSSVCVYETHYLSQKYDQQFVYAEFVDQDTKDPLISYGQLMGEWWVAYADQASDTNGKYRLAPFQKANMDSASFLHVTMEVDIVSTARRYPQILISDRDTPVQDTLDQGHTLIVQPRNLTNSALDWPINYEIQLCKLRTWDVNNQCPSTTCISSPRAT